MSTSYRLSVANAPESAKWMEGTWQDDDDDDDAGERADLEDQDDVLFDDLLEDLTEDLALYQDEALVQEALNKGLDLRQSSRQIDDDLRKIERLSIQEHLPLVACAALTFRPLSCSHFSCWPLWAQDYLKESSNLTTLQENIRVCNGVLGSVEAVLAGFQGSLGRHAMKSSQPHVSRHPASLRHATYPRRTHAA